MSARKSLPVGALFMILVIALALLGVGYALWSETLTISGTVQTGEVDVEFSTYPVEECVDVNGVLTCPEPPEKADAANCTVDWSGPDGDSEGDDGPDQLLVTVTGMYPSWHCKVKFDVTSTGSVPVHVWLPEPAEEIPVWVATNFENCYADGVQLHQGDSTGECTMDLHFTNKQAPPEGSGPYTFGWTILATQWNEDPVSGPVVEPGYSSLIEAAGVRYKGINSGGEIYIGIPDLGTGDNRNETVYSWVDGTYDVAFAFDPIENKITTSIDGPGGPASIEYDFDVEAVPPTCAIADWNAMDILLRDGRADSAMEFNNVTLNGIPLGNFGPFDLSGTYWSNWTVKEFDFSQSFTVLGDLTVQNFTGNEAMKLQLSVGCLP